MQPCKSKCHRYTVHARGTSSKRNKMSKCHQSIETKHLNTPVKYVCTNIANNQLSLLNNKEKLLRQTNNNNITTLWWAPAHPRKNLYKPAISIHTGNFNTVIFRTHLRHAVYKLTRALMCMDMDGLTRIDIDLLFLGTRPHSQMSIKHIFIARTYIAAYGPTNLW